MRILIIRHADPDYEHDCLTEKGKREAALLSESLRKQNISAVYCSPLGRARQTCAETARKIHADPVVLPWLREFDHPVLVDGKPHLCWDMLPSFLAQHPELYDANAWLASPVMQTGDIRARYTELCEGLDGVLAGHGYVRDGMFYRAARANRSTIAFFCHFGTESMLLSHLCNTSPVPLSHHFVALTSSVTTLYSEERRQGMALFRCCGYGDCSHLLVGKEPPSFSARFCEVFDSDERHD